MMKAYAETFYKFFLEYLFISLKIYTYVHVYI